MKSTPFPEPGSDFFTSVAASMDGECGDESREIVYCTSSIL